MTPAERRDLPNRIPEEVRTAVKHLSPKQGAARLPKLLALVARCSASAYNEHEPSELRSDEGNAVCMCLAHVGETTLRVHEFNAFGLFPLRALPTHRTIK